MEKDNCNIRCKNEVVELINNPHSKTQDVITLIQKQIEKYHYLIGTTAYIKYLYDNVGWEELSIWGRGKPMMNPDRTGYLYDELSILMEHYSELEEMEQNHLPCATQPEKSDDTQSLNKEPQQRKSIATRGKGRPKETLKEKMINDADGGKLQKIHTKMDGKKGKDAALIILACIKKGWMLKPTYTQVKNEFGDIGSKSGYNTYLKEQRFTKEELDGAINCLD